jgi:hypothetical protein
VSTTPLEALIREQKALISALDSDDVAAIELHTASVDAALVRVRASGVRAGNAQAKQLAEEARTLADAARVRLNVLADMTSRRLTRLAAATGKGDASPTYGRTGRLGR